MKNKNCLFDFATKSWCFFISLLTLDKMPESSEIDKAPNKRKYDILVGVFYLLIFLGFCFGIYKVLYLSKLKSDVGLMTIPGVILLGLSFVTLALSSWISFVSVNKIYIKAVSQRKQSKKKDIFSALLSVVFTVYSTFFSVNEAYLTGKYNPSSYQGVCDSISTSGAKSEECIKYESDYERDSSVLSRVFYFL